MASRSWITGRAPSGSMSTARKRTPACLSAGTTRSRCERLRTRIATVSRKPEASVSRAIRATFSASAARAAFASRPAQACHCTATPGRSGWCALDAEYGTAPASASSARGSTRLKLSLTQSTRPACERKLIASRSGVSVTCGSPSSRACRKSATSASRKR